jgi:hypothetical protein
MKPLQLLERCIHGWLPEELNLSSRQQAPAHGFFPTRKAAVAYIALILGAAAVGGLFDAIGEISGISSSFGIFWPVITSMAIAITGALIYGRLYRREQRKEAQPR